MSKKTSYFRQHILSTCLTFGACLSLAVVSPLSHAEIYKWTDVKGQTHYSENKEEAGKAAQELKIKSQAASTATSTSPTPSWQLQEQEFKRRQAQKQLEPTNGQAANKNTKPARGEDQPETDTTRCKLARAILEGRARHGNGAPVDNNDKQIAARDTQNYCH